MRDNGIKDFPDPAKDGPLIDTTKIPSGEGSRCSGHSGVHGRAGEVPRLPRQRTRRPVKRKTWALAAAPVLVAVIATGGVVAMSNAEQATPAAPGAGEHREGRTGELSAMVSLDGTLTYRARPDGSAVLRDQPGPRDLHQAARRRREGRLRRRVLSGRRRPGAAAVWPRSRPTATCRSAIRARTSVSSNATCVRSCTTRSKRSSTTRAFAGPERLPSVTRSSCRSPCGSPR